MYLKTILEQKIPQGLTLGYNPRKLAKMVDKELNTGYNATVRLIRTEYNALQNEATFEGYKACGVKQYQILATLDSRTSEICQDMDLRIFKITEKEVGVNYPPLHISCRSTTIPYFEPDEIDEEFGTLPSQLTRLAKDKNGNYIKVSMEMNYKEWKEKFV